MKNLICLHFENCSLLINDKGREKVWFEQQSNEVYGMEMYSYVHKKFTSGSISPKKSYGRFQFQAKNSLHWSVHAMTS
jgi:hypothetical protein